MTTPTAKIPAAERTAYHAATRAADQMSDGELRRAFASAEAVYYDRDTPATRGRWRSLADEMAHRDCYA